VFSRKDRHSAVFSFYWESVKNIFLRRREGKFLDPAFATRSAERVAKAFDSPIPATKQ
jgi:hypothetical protein